jgi:hypothetical protein
MGGAALAVAGIGLVFGASTGVRKRLSILAGAALMLSGGLATSAAANTINYSLTVDDCTGTCGTAPFGTVTATDIGAGEVQITVTLKAGENFVNTGAGAGQALLFDLAGAPTLTDYTDVSSNVPIVLASTTAGSLSADGTGTWQYGVNCPSCGNGNSPPMLDSPITFDISATGLSTASLVQNGNGLYFAADIIGTNLKTGDVGAPTPVGVPRPTAGAGLPGLALAGIGLFVGWRRRRRADA